MALVFKGNQLVFCTGRLWFGPDCPGSCIPSAPTCLALRRSDFVVCGGCDPGSACGAVPVWAGILSFDGVKWSVPLSCTASGRKVKAQVTLASGTYTLLVQCADNTVVWQGTHTGPNPIGQYARSAGCDTSDFMFMY